MEILTAQKKGFIIRVINSTTNIINSTIIIIFNLTTIFIITVVNTTIINTITLD